MGLKEKTAVDDCLLALPALLRAWARESGFSALGIARASGSALDEAAAHLDRWLQLQCHGSMDYMVKHAGLRSSPAALLPGVETVISVTLPYWPAKAAADGFEVLADAQTAFISRYALGRDYHKIVRNRLAGLEKKLHAYLAEHVGSECAQTVRAHSRVFSDSAPVFEVEFARQGGLGWRGKHTLLLSRQGSWHFLGEIYTSLPLPVDDPVKDHCGHCRRCLDICPTAAIVEPYRVDARRCISYLTIEHAGPIPEALRPLLGNRIYGCDDCQLVCPWNRFSQAGDAGFLPRHGLDSARLVDLFSWDEPEFLERLAGNPIRRIGHQRWLRNIAVALGNARSINLRSGRPIEPIDAALRGRLNDSSALVREHIEWALHRAV